MKKNIITRLLKTNAPFFVLIAKQKMRGCGDGDQYGIDPVLCIRRKDIDTLPSDMKTNRGGNFSHPDIIERNMSNDDYTCFRELMGNFKLMQDDENGKIYERTLR